MTPVEKSLDERVTDFLRLFAAASVFQHRGCDELAVPRFLEAARCAPTCADETLSLTRAFACSERRQGAIESDEHPHGYGHGI